MTEQNIADFREWFKFIDERASEIIKYKYPDKYYDGIEVEKDYIYIKYSTYIGDGEYDRDSEPICGEDLDENTNIAEKYKADYEEYQWKKMLQEEASEEMEKKMAMYRIEQLKKQYGIK